MKNKKCCGECWQHPCPAEKKYRLKEKLFGKPVLQEGQPTYDGLEAGVSWRDISQQKRKSLLDYTMAELAKQSREDGKPFVQFQGDIRHDVENGPVIDIDVDAIYHTHEQMVKRLIDELEAPQYRKLTFREKYYGILPWLAIGIVVWIFIFTLARVVVSDDGLQEIKRGVDARGEYVFYEELPTKTKPAPDGPFKGNCTVFAMTYIKKAREAGYYANLYIIKNKKYNHAVALATGRDGKYYVLDNQENQIVPQWKHKQRWGY